MPDKLDWQKVFGSRESFNLSCVNLDKLARRVIESDCDNSVYDDVKSMAIYLEAKSEDVFKCEDIGKILKDDNTMRRRMIAAEKERLLLKSTARGIKYSNTKSVDAINKLAGKAVSGMDKPNVSLIFDDYPLVYSATNPETVDSPDVLLQSLYGVRGYCNAAIKYYFTDRFSKLQIPYPEGASQGLLRSENFPETVTTDLERKFYADSKIESWIMKNARLGNTLDPWLEAVKREDNDIKTVYAQNLWLTVALWLYVWDVRMRLIEIDYERSKTTEKYGLYVLK